MKELEEVVVVDVWLPGKDSDAGRDGTGLDWTCRKRDGRTSEVGWVG